MRRGKKMKGWRGESGLECIEIDGMSHDIDDAQLSSSIDVNICYINLPKLAVLSLSLFFFSFFIYIYPYSFSKTAAVIHPA
jgi:hypothetical protein